MKANYQGKTRYWSAFESYATGDVLLGMIASGWEVSEIKHRRHAKQTYIYTVTLVNDGEQIALPVLDCPAVRDLDK